MDLKLPEVKLDVTMLSWRAAVSIELYMHGACVRRTRPTHGHCVPVFVSLKPVINGRRSLRIVAGA